MEQNDIFFQEQWSIASNEGAQLRCCYKAEEKY